MKQIYSFNFYYAFHNLFRSLSDIEEGLRDSIHSRIGVSSETISSTNSYKYFSFNLRYTKKNIFKNIFLPAEAP